RGRRADLPGLAWGGEECSFCASCCANRSHPPPWFPEAGPFDKDERRQSETVADSTRRAARLPPLPDASTVRAAWLADLQLDPIRAGLASSSLCSSTRPTGGCRVFRGSAPCQPLRCACLVPKSSWMPCIVGGVAPPQRLACQSSEGVLFQAR